MDTGQLIAGIVFLAILIYFIGGFVLGAVAISAREIAIWLLLRQYGKVSEAAIVELCANKQGRGWSYYIRFAPLDDDESSVIQFIHRRTYKRLQEHTFVTITYLPDRPRIARLWGKYGDTWSRGFPTVLAIVFIGVAWPLIVLWLSVFALVYLMPQVANHPIFRRIDSWECGE